LALASILGLALIRVQTQKNRAEEYTQLLLDATPLSCTLWNRDLKIVNGNAEAMRLFEVADKDQLCKDFMTFRAIAPAQQGQN